MQLYVMRHGQTNYNLRGLCNSDPSRDVHLTETGIQQAQQAAKELQDVELELILVSELPRTQQTAEIVNQHHNIEIRSQPEMNDIRSGFEDRPVMEYQAAIARDRLNSKCNDGESLLEHKQRIVQFLDKLPTKDYSSVLLVAHEETLRVIDGYFHHLPDENMIELHFKNCEILRYSIP